MRARLHLRGGRAGFFLEGTHTLCDAGLTRQLLPAAVGAVHELADRLAAAGFAEDADIELSENRAGDQRAMHVELTRTGSRAAVPPLASAPRRDGAVLERGGRSRGIGSVRAALRGGCGAGRAAAPPHARVLPGQPLPARRTGGGGVGGVPAWACRRPLRGRRPLRAVPGGERPPPGGGGGGPRGIGGRPRRQRQALRRRCPRRADERRAVPVRGAAPAGRSRWCWTRRAPA